MWGGGGAAGRRGPGGPERPREPDVRPARGRGLDSRVPPALSGRAARVRSWACDRVAGSSTIAPAAALGVGGDGTGVGVAVGPSPEICKVLMKWGALKGPSKVREGAPSEKCAWERERGLWGVGGEESRGLDTWDLEEVGDLVAWAC